MGGIRNTAGQLPDQWHRTFWLSRFNLAIHAATAISFWGVLREFFVHRNKYWPNRIAGRAEFLAFSIAALWAAHPITSQAVTYVIQRTELLWSLALLIGMYLYLRGSRRCQPIDSEQTNQRPWWRSEMLVSIPVFWIGMSCKEPIVPTLLALPLLDRVFGDFTLATWLRRRGVYYGCLSAPVMLALPLLWRRIFDQSVVSSGGLFTQTVTPWEYWSTQPEAISIYCARVLIPVGYCFDYLWPPQTNGLLLLAEIALFSVFSLLVARAAWRGSAWSLPAALFLLCLSTTSLVPLIDLVVEHRMYLASAWLIALFAVAMESGYNAIRRSDGEVGRLPAWWGQVLVGIAVIVLIVISFQRSKVYHSPLTLWEDTVQKADWNYRAHVNYANELLKVERTDEAVQHCRTAIEQKSFCGNQTFSRRRCTTRWRWRFRNMVMSRARSRRPSGLLNSRPVEAITYCGSHRFIPHMAD